MKITDVKAYAVPVPVERPYIWRDGLPGSGTLRETTWLRIITDEGIEGWAAIGRGAIVVDLVRRRIRDMLIGQDPVNREYLWERMWEVDRVEEFPIYMLGAVDIALWDILGKMTGLPVYKLLGGYRDRILAYASTVTYSSVEEYLDIAGQALAAGFKAIKLHAWGDARRDAVLCTRLREHVGDDIPLMYDGSAGFDLIDALYLGEALADAGYLWYEEPMREFSTAAYRMLREKLRLPLLSGETSDGVHFNIADFIVNGGADLVRTSSHYKGGFTGAMRVAHLAEAFYMRAEVHGSGVANRHLCMAIRNNTFYETLVMDNPMVSQDAVDDEGYVYAPTEPGVGYQIDLERIEREAFATV